jgi:hypothetical protein
VRRRTRLTVATALAAALLITTAPAATAAPDRCADAPESDFADRERAREVHRASIDCVDYANIARGREENGQRFYAPLEEVTRGQMASFIIQTLEAAGYEDELPSGEATDEDPDEFDDIASSVHRERINQLARIGVANGVGDGTRYAPGRSITRQQMASFIVAATEFALVADYEAQGSHFSDVGQRNVHFNNINAGYEEGLFSGTTPPRRGVPNSGKFSPARNVLRDQMASFLTNLLDLIEQ